MKPAFFTISAVPGIEFGRNPEPVIIPEYSAATERVVLAKVLAAAHREGYSGNDAEARMNALGWKVVPVYTAASRDKWWECPAHQPESLQEAIEEMTWMREDWVKLAKAMGFDTFTDPDKIIERASSAITSDDLKAVLDLLAVMHGDGGHYAAKHGIAKAAADALRPGTPAARWRADGMPDPHGDLYNCERADLALGNYTDDELANAVFLYGDKRPTMDELKAGEILPIALLSAAKDRIRWLSRKLVEASAKPSTLANFTARVGKWMDVCFVPSLYSNMTERGDRFLEEVLEKLQSHDYDPTRIPTLVSYVWGRPKGEPSQESGGVMVTLAGLDYIAGVDLDTAAWSELRRIELPEVMAKIQRKQAAKNALHFDTPVPGSDLKVVPLVSSDSQEIDPRVGPIPVRGPGQRRVGDPGYRVGIDPMPGE